MIKNSFLLSLVFVLTTLIPNFAYSQATVINFPAACSNIGDLAELISEFDEQTTLTMTSIRDTGDGNSKNHTLLVFVNFKTKTWTMAERVSNELFCIIATGIDMKPYVKKERK